MFNRFSFIPLVLLFLFVSCHRQEEAIARRPFPQHINYAGDYIQPNNYSQAELDDHTQEFYDQWKDVYLHKCGENQYYVDFGNEGIINVSEGLGYGMMITAFMAGYDPEAKKYFDGLYRFYKNHPSSINPYLMAWAQVDGCIDKPDGGDNSASDGDIDIAFALLLADRQWGSEGEIDYLSEAQKIINAIMQSDINPQTWTVKLGDWANASEADYFFATRTSDFILDHFRVFAKVQDPDKWNFVLNTCYRLIDKMQLYYSTQTGLLPDFIVNTNDQAQPAPANFLESPYDGQYFYNACRDPWRIATDYLISGDDRSKAALDKINTWIISSTGADPDKISSGYDLDGRSLADYNDIPFYGAFAVSAMLSHNQQWLNKLYDKLITDNLEDNDYYGNTLKMLYLIVISGNYWVP